ncbi:MAG: hypothetical protein HC787_02870 [Nostocaceae cyanobacterium CSU_2_110]|nr:hypothetical protein [Nostocaceae cyanobacterium CSU_2_110]
MQRARYLKTISEKENLDHLSIEELKKKSYLGVAKHRISQTVEKLMEHNDTQGEKVNKVCITRGIVFKLTGSNRKTINEF